jgi:G3E family GTPase
MQSALLEIKENFTPDRIIIECSGSAFPATLAFQIRQLEKDTEGAFKLDAIVTVIDAENFAGYEDTSPTARMQASYSDVILIVSFPSSSIWSPIVTSSPEQMGARI